MMRRISSLALAALLALSPLARASGSIILAATTDSLELETSGAFSTDYSCSWVDSTTSAFTPGSTTGNISTATTTTIVAAPAASTQRKISGCQVYNRSGSTQTVTFKRDISATEYFMFKTALLTLEMVQWNEEDGFRIFDANGLVKSPLIVGGGTEATALRVTVANDSTGVLSVDDNGSSLTVDASNLDVQIGGSDTVAVVGTGTAGAPAGNILTVQGVASMTKLLVTPDSVALPANQSVNVAQVAGTNTVTGGVAGIIAVGGNVANAVAATANPVPVGGIFSTTPATLTNGQTATMQFTAAQNQKNDITTIAGTAPTVAGKLDVKAADGDVFVRQATATNLNAAVVGTGTAGTPAGNILTVQGVASMTKLLVTPDSVALPANQSVNVAQIAGTNTVTGGVAGIIAVGGNVANAVAATANPVPVGGIFTTTPATLTTGQTATMQFTAAQNQKTDITTVAGTAPTTVGKLDVKAADGDVFVRQSTATNLNAAVVGTGTAGTPAGNILTVQGVASMTKLLVTPDSVALPANQSVNVAQVAGTNTVTGGVAGIIAVGGNVANAVAATANPVPVGGIFTTTPATLTTGQTATAQFTAAQNLKHDVTTIAGTAPTTAGKLDVKAADGDVFVRQATATNLNAAVVGTGTAGTPAGNILTVQGVASMTKLLVTPDSVALPANQSTNVAQFGGTNVSTGTGAGGAGIPRVTVSNDSSLAANQSVNVAQIAGTNTVTGGVAGIIAVGGNVANAVAATANPVPVGGIFTTTPATLTTGQTATMQFTPAQNLKHDFATIAATLVDVNSGNKSAGTQRFVLATDQPNLTTALNVNCTAGCTAGGSFADAAAFTFGTTAVSNTSFVVDDTATNTVAENSAGAARMNTNRILYHMNTNSTGTEVGTAGSPFGVNLAQVGAATVATAASGVQKVGVVGNAGATLDAVIGVATAPTNQVVTGSVFNTTAPAPTTGQSMALQAEQAGNLRTFSGIALKTLTAWTVADSINATQNIFTLSGAGSVLLHLVTTTTITAGAITFEVSYDNTNWVTIPADAVLDPASTTFAQIALPYTLVASTNKPFLLVGKGWQGLRIKLSTAITGTGSSTPNYALLDYEPAKTVIALSPTAANFNATATLSQSGTNNDVDVVSQIPGTGATNLGKAEDSGHGSTDTGVMALAVQQQADGTPTEFSATDLDYSPISVDSFGTMSGALYMPWAWTYHENSSSALTDTTVHASCGSGLFNYIDTMTVSTGAATALNVFIEDSTTTTILGPYYLEAVAGRGFSVNYLPGKKQTTAATLISITTSAAIAHGIDIQGHCGR